VTFIIIIITVVLYNW